MAACVVASEINWTDAFWIGVIAVAVIWAFGLGAGIMAEDRGRDPLAGAVLGVLLGPVGWLLIAMLGRKR